MGPVLDFFQTLLDSLSAQVGTAYVTEVIGVFLSLLGGDQLARILTDATGADMRGTHAVNRYVVVRARHGRQCVDADAALLV